MKQPVLILQYFGLGDCLFAQGIAQYFIEQGHNVVWPVKREYYDGLRRAYPSIDWVPHDIVKPELFLLKEKKEVDGMLIAPIRWSDSYMKVQYKYVMRAKYDMYDLDWKLWKEAAMWERDLVREHKLMIELDLVGKKYNLINKRFGSSAERSVDIQVGNDYENVEMREVEGYSLFDWSLILERAQEIHTVSTSLLFILEVLPLTMPIHLYCRKPVEADFSFVEYIFTKPYILHK